MGESPTSGLVSWSGVLIQVYGQFEAGGKMDRTHLCLLANLCLLLMRTAVTMVALHFLGFSFWWILIASPFVLIAWHLLVERGLSRVVNYLIEKSNV